MRPGETCEVSIAALVGGKFELPSGTSLVSAVYSISVSKALLQPVQLSIQHCVSLETQEHTSYLSFVTADLYQPLLPYQFRLEQGGQFNPSDQYGSIMLSDFSLKAIVKAVLRPIQRLLGYCDNQEVTDIFDETLLANSDTDFFLTSNEQMMLESQMTFRDEGDPSRQSPIILYVGQVVYEVKHQTEWLMKFIVAQNLNALLKYIHTSLPNAEKDINLFFQFEEENGYIELIFGEEQEYSFQGWTVCPHLHPTRISQRVVDIYGANISPQFPSCLVTISATLTSITVPVFQYSITLKGIKSTFETTEKGQKINIVRSLGQIVSQQHTTDRTAGIIMSSVDGDQDNSLPNTQNQFATLNTEHIKKCFRRHFADLSKLMSVSNNRLSIFAELFSKQLITETCYDDCTDDSNKTDAEKGHSLMRALKATIHSQPQSVIILIGVLRNAEAFRLIARKLEHDLSRS